MHCEKCLEKFQDSASSVQNGIRSLSKLENPENRCQELLRDWLEENHDDAPKTWFTLLNTIAEDKTFTRSIERTLKRLEEKHSL